MRKETNTINNPFPLLQFNPSVAVLFFFFERVLLLLWTMANLSTNNSI